MGNSTIHLDPKKHFVFINLVAVDGIKSISLSRPNEEATIETDMYGVATISENPQGSIFNSEITIASQSTGVIVANIPVIAKTLTPFAIINSETQLPVVSDEKARILFTSWGVDSSGNDIPTGFKVIGTANKFIL